jgi:glycosyltransferase involved in cell wall biosynthesis
VITIGVDAREILGDTTGVGRYLSELLTRWTSRPDASARRFILFAPRAITLPLSRDHVETRVLPAAHGGTWWEQTTLRQAVGRERLDRFFAPAYTAPLGLTIPLALTIHDVSFLAHPEWFRPRERLRRRWLTKQSARSAAVVLTDSIFSRDEIVKHTGLDVARVRIIPPGVSARHAGPGAPPAGRERLVLFVGTLLNRRRVPQLVDAFAVAAADLPDARLVIVGADRTWPAQDLGALTARLGVGSKVDVRSYVGDAELASLYARASVFVFLSEYEGFGLTPLEALAAGVPIVVLDTPIAREVYGPAATYVGPATSVTDTAWIIRSLLIDKSAARERMAVAPAVLARYSWDQAAHRTLEAIETASGPR